MTISSLDHVKRYDRPQGTDLSNWRESPYNQWAFHHVQEVVPCATIDGSAIARSFGVGVDANLNEYQLDSGESLNALLLRASTDSMVVLHRGQKVWQWQAQHCDISRPHIVFSVSKSITAMLAGIVADMGLLDFSKVVSHYLPAAKDSGYGDCTVQQVLDMTVALAFREDYLNPDGDYNRYRDATGWNPVDQTGNQETLEPLLYSLGKADYEHGEMFNYKSPNSDLIGLLLERVTGVCYADLLSQLLWQPMGAEHDGCVTVDRAFLARGAGGICIHIDDLARVGQLMLDRGAVNGQQVISESWISDTLTAGNPEAWARGDFIELLPNGAYRNKWYQVGDADRCFIALGIHGQWLYVNPTTEVVIVKLSSQPLPVDDTLDMTLLGAFGKLTRAI